MTDINLDALSVEQLQALHAGIDSAIERRKNTEILEVRAQLDALIDGSPFTLEEVLAATVVKRAVAPKYRNPNDASQTWTGRGRRPRWVEDYLAAGGGLEAITI